MTPTVTSPSLVAHFGQWDEGRNYSSAGFEPILRGITCLLLVLHISRPWEKTLPKAAAAPSAKVKEHTGSKSKPEAQLR